MIHSGVVPPQRPLMHWSPAVQQSDAVVIVTDHDAFDYEMIRKRSRYVLDTRNRIRGPRVESL